MRRTLGDRTIKDHNLFTRQKRWSLLMHLFCLSNDKKHCEREIHGYFQALLVNQNCVRNQWYRSWTFRLDFASIDGYNSWLQVSLNFTDNNWHCLYVSTAPSKSRRKDNSALLELCHWKSRVWIVQVPCQRNGTFSATTASSLVRFFHDLAAFTSRNSCKSLSFLVTSLKIELENSEKLHFSAKEKKNCKQTDCELTSACFMEI